MAKKITIHDYHSLAESKGFKWVGDSQPRKVIDKTIWQCSNGHEFTSSYNKIKSGSKCKVCIGYGQKTPYDYKILADKLGFTVSVVTPSNTRTPTDWICSKGHTWKASYDNVNRGTGCPTCAGVKQKSRRDYHNLAESKGFKWIGKLPSRTVHKTSWICNKGHTFTSSYHNLLTRGCSICANNVSKYEIELREFITETDGCTQECNKRFYYDGTKYFELDIFLPNKKIGIEFHGLYWHSEDKIGKYLHRDKHRYFKSRGIQVIQIFENEWCNKKDIVKSIIANMLSVSTKVYGRKCIVVELDTQESSSFLNSNHVQGTAGSAVKLGLKHNDVLVAVMTFGPSRYSNKEYELIRYCSRLNTSVIGGFSKLLKHFTCNFNFGDKLISYCDLRYFTGSGYLKSGFEFIKYTAPNYFYFKSGSTVLESRHKYQKYKLHKVLDEFDGTLSEYDNMRSNNYFRIFDAGNLKLEYNLKK